MNDEECRRTSRDSAYAGWRLHGSWEPLQVVRAEGVRFWDDGGKEYLDFASQLVAMNLGYGNRAVIRAMGLQAEELPYLNPAMTSRIRGEVSARLPEVLPAGLTRYFFSTSGTEANEAATRIARLATGRHHILARTRSYHGSTAASIAVSGDPRRDATPASAQVGAALFAPDCYCYRCPFGLTYPSCKVRCASDVEGILQRDGDVAAMIVEPIVGTNGVIVPVPEYLPMIRAITRQHGVMLIADEVMTGWGRTGAWFAVDHWRVVPDILTTAKGLTGAYAPLALTATTEEVSQRLEGRYLPLGHTYEAHPMGLAAAAAAIDEYRRLDLIEKSRRDGEYLLGRLRAIQSRHPSVGEVRGLGLFAAIELVSDRTGRIPFNTGSDLTNGRTLLVDSVRGALLRDGVYVLGWISHLLLAPPLTISRNDLDRGLDAIDRALGIADAEVRKAKPAAEG
ncbi:MAG: aminotransferase family protein [Thermoplasmata archaeon]